MQKRNSSFKLGLAIAAAALALVTLLPGDFPDVLGLVACLACGDLSTLDAIHNALLFIPVGLIFVRALGNPWRAAGLAGLVSLGIEFVQLVVLPSRDPALLDLAMNTSGGPVGVPLSRGWHRLQTAQRPPVRLLMLAATLVPVQAGLGARGMVAGTEAAAGGGVRFLALDATLGWALLLPFELALGDWHHVISAFWTAVLFLPLGFLSGWRVGIRVLPVPA